MRADADALAAQLVEPRQPQHHNTRKSYPWIALFQVGYRQIDIDNAAAGLEIGQRVTKMIDGLGFGCARGYDIGQYQRPSGITAVVLLGDADIGGDDPVILWAAIGDALDVCGGGRLG